MAVQNRILLVSWTVPPIKSGSVFIIEQFIKFFSKEELVILGESTHNHSHENIHYVASNPIQLKKGNRFISWYRWLLIPRITKEIISVYQAKKCTLILCVFPDEIYLEAARRAAKKLKAPFYPYFHNTYLENRSGFSRFMARRIQPKVFHQAKKAYVMSEGLVKWYQPLYPNISFQALVHPFVMQKAGGYKGLAFNDAILTITYLGNLNESNIDAFRFFVECISEMDKVELKIISSTPAWFYEKLSLLKKNVRILSSVSDEGLMKELQNSHLLFLPHGFNGGLSELEYQTIFPTRTIQYLFSGVPILGLFPDKTFLCEFLREHQCAEIITVKNQSTIAARINYLKNNPLFCQTLVNNALKTSDLFLAQNVLENLKKEIFSPR